MVTGSTFIWRQTPASRGCVVPDGCLIQPACSTATGQHRSVPGLATRQEFFDAVARRDVRALLEKELGALCQARAPEDRWQWTEPPLKEDQVVPVQLPSLEEEDLLTNPVEELRRARQLLRD